MVHNHPSGDPTPSEEDIRVTGQLIEAGKLLDIQVPYHLVVAQNGFIRLKEKGLGFELRPFHPPLLHQLAVMSLQSAIKEGVADSLRRALPPDRFLLHTAGTTASPDTFAPSQRRFTRLTHAHQTNP